MSKKKKDTGPIITNSRGAEIAELRKTPRQDRSEEDILRLRELVQEQCRERFVKHAGGRLRKAVSALKRLTQLANGNSFRFTAADRDRIIEDVTVQYNSLCEAFADPEDNGHASKPFPWDLERTTAYEGDPADTL